MIITMSFYMLQIVFTLFIYSNDKTPQGVFNMQNLTHAAINFINPFQTGVSKAFRVNG